MNNFKYILTTIATASLSLAGVCANSQYITNTESTTTSETADTILTKTISQVDDINYLVLRMDSERTRVTLVDSLLPDIDDPNIVLCVEAAFTGELLPEFSTTNIAGDYVIDGVFHKGYECDANTGFLCTVDGCPVILPMEYCQEWTRKAQDSGATLFQQMHLLQDTKYVYQGRPIKPEKPNIYRGACVMQDGGFAIIQSLEYVPLGQFIASLVKLGVRDAVYLDMGTGWNYGWYRETTDSAPVKFFEKRTPYQTNWLIIKVR